VLLGDTGVGKTSIINKYVKDVFCYGSPATIGIDFGNKVIRKEEWSDEHGGAALESDVQLTLWDTAGQEMYKSLNQNYFRGTNGCIFVYDQTSKKSFANLQNWLQYYMAFDDQLTDA